MDTVDEIKSKLSIEDVVAPYVQLKKMGSSFKGLCPFHQEKTPSFIVSPNKGLAYCFGCRKGGDMFAFMQELENIDFPEAIKLLADKCGIEVKKTAVNRHSKEEKTKQLEVLEKAHSFFMHQLTLHPGPLKYLAARGYPLEKASHFQLGFAPDNYHLLTETLKKQGFSPAETLSSGVAAQKEIGSSSMYDRFRNRIIFPIHNAQGTLVAFGGRTMSADKEIAKYLNSPESGLYHKRSTLYLFHMAKESIKQQNKAIIVEGYFDALTAHLHGFTNTVASLGTALTEEQLKLIKRVTSNVLFAFDADQSGQAAAARSIEIAQQMGFTIHIIRVPTGKDPDEAIRENKSLWEQAQESALPIMDFHFKKSFAAHTGATLEGKKRIVEELLPVISQFQSAIDRQHYIQQLSLELQIPTSTLEEELQKLKSHLSIGGKVKKPDSEKTVQPHRYTRTDYLLGILGNYGEYVAAASRLINDDLFPEGEQKRLYSQLKNSYTSAGEKFLEKIENEQDREQLELLIIYTEQKYAAFTKEELSRELENICKAINQDHRVLKLKALRFQMADLERQEESKSQEKRYKKLLQQYSSLLKPQPKD
jgi:DNA primase